MGLTKLQAGEFVTFGTDEGKGNEIVTGIALTLTKTEAIVAVFGNDRLIGQGTSVSRGLKLVGVPTGKVLLGRVVDALGNAIDGLGKIDTTKSKLYAIDVKAPGIISRQTVN